MKTIWKLPLEPQGLSQEVALQMPYGSVILNVGYDPQNLPCVWYECEPGAAMTTRRFFIAFTGAPVPEGATYIGTLVGHFIVGHVYELGR